jgi:hypothetical protein
MAFVSLFLALVPSAAAFGCVGDLFQVHNLLPTNDASLVQDLQTILGSYRYTENYSAGRFDCMDTTTIATRILQDYGFYPSTIGRIALKKWPGESHAWLAVPDGKGHFAFIETCAFASGMPCLGAVVSAEESKDYASGYVFLNPMQTFLCFGYTEERFLNDLHKTEKIVSGPILLNRDQPKESNWVYI